MTNLFSASIYRSSAAKAVLFGVMALCGAAAPAHGQEAVAGKFTLTKETHLGKKVLPAGSYTFMVEPTGMVQSLSSIQGGRHVVQVAIRPLTESGPVSLTFAMATRTSQPRDSSNLVLERSADGMTMHTLSLGEQGLLLDFDWSSAKAKPELVAQAPPSGSSAGSKATD